jgi:hypothetical protein
MLNVKQQLTDFLQKELLECTDCETKRITGEGECYGYTENTNLAISRLIEKIPELEICIRESISHDLFEYAKKTGQLLHINTLQVFDVIKDRI